MHPLHQAGAEGCAHRLSTHRKIKLSAVVAVIALAAAAAFGMSAAAARAPGGSSVTFASKPATVSSLNHFTQLPHGIKPDLAFLACQGTSELTPTGPCAAAPPADDGDVPGSADNAPNISGNSMGSATGSLGSNFNGISDVLQRTVTGFHFTPPHQGLCVGSAGALEGAGVPLGVPPGSTVVVEMVNDGWAVYTRSGQRLWLDSNIDLFGDPYSSGDIECNFDQQTQTYYFTEIGALNGLYYGTNLVVMNHGGYSAYYVDTAEGGDCFPDFPHQGYDNNAFYITINEFCGADEEFAGANIYALSKQQLVFHHSVNGFFWELPDSYYSFRAAAGDPTNTEYLLASEQNDFTQNALDFATVTGDNRIISGHSPFLTVTAIPSESFTEPVMALSTGDGTTCEQHLTTSDGTPYCSVPESWLDPTDMRLEQVQYSHGQLYTSLDTALTVGNDPTVVDGAAWFQVDPRSASVVRQGYVGVAGTYLLMPSIYRTDTGLAKPGSSNPGTLMMGFSMTSPTLNPSSGYVVSKNQGGTFSPVTTTGPGSGPHISFSGTQPGYMRNRWGDYSRIAVDPVTGNAWMADEYIPPPPDGADTVDNWGTRVWEVKR
jgi:hypothetical protein